MESFIDSNNTYLNKFHSFTSDSAYTIHGALVLLISAVLIFLLLILYKKIRRKFPVKVNCWFCSSYTKVPYELSNSWDCPNCDQYNGFTKDGNYNKVIKEQYNSKLNQEVFETVKSSTVKNKTFNLQKNGFCKLCNINQQLKIQQLALFVPINKNNYFEEIEKYKEKLEKAYQLCTKCEKVLQETLEKQEYKLLQNRLNDHKQKISLNSIPSFNKTDIKRILFKLKNTTISGLQWVSMITATLLFIALFTKLETEFKFLYFSLPEVVILESLQPFFKILFRLINEVYNFSKELSFAGFICSLLCLSERHIKANQINLLIWGLLHILLWTYMTEFQIFMSSVSLYFNHQILQSKPIYLNKKSLPKKYSFQPEQKIFSKTFTSPRDEAVDFAKSMPTRGNDSFGSSNSSPESKFRDSNKTSISPQESIRKREKNKKNEIECLTDEGKEASHSDVTNPKPAPLNSSVFSKSFLSMLEGEKSQEASESMDEVYSNFSGLHLGGKQKKHNKPNFLFANHNFSDKKSTSSIIKPAKFVKNPSTSWTESNESASRSSTPSSGYSSQKAEKIEPNRYDFHKTISPITVNPFSQHPRDRFDYFDGGNSYYNNYNCFSPGFVPFQQFPGPMGHTTVYTCTRPGSFPFPFFQGFPQKFSPMSPRFSDASECENLFQNASKNLENSRKWVKLKTLAYFSIFLNIITFLVLVYFVSYGIIAVDWNLPKLNFFF